MKGYDTIKKKAFFITMILFLLVGCSKIENRYGSLSEIKPDPEYFFVGRDGITKNNKHYDFTDEIDKEIRSDRKLTDGYHYLDYIQLTDTRMYFLHDYYSPPSKNDEQTKDYCFGYYDFELNETIILEYYEGIQEDTSYTYDTNIDLCVFNNTAYLMLGSDLKEYDIVSKTEIAEYEMDDCFSYQDSLVIKDGGNLTLFTPSGKTTFELQLYIFHYYFISGNSIVFRGTKTENGSSFNYGYDITTGMQLADDIVEDMVTENFEYKPQTCVCDGVSYNIDVEDEQIEFENCETEQITTITISDVSSKCSEYDEITEMFDKEGIFSNVVVQGEEVFIIIHKEETAYFGFLNNRSIPPLAFKVSNNFTEIEYVGYYGFPFDTIIGIFPI